MFFAEMDFVLFSRVVCTQQERKWLTLWSVCETMCRYLDGLQRELLPSLKLLSSEDCPFTWWEEYLFSWFFNKPVNCYINFEFLCHVTEQTLQN